MTKTPASCSSDGDKSSNNSGIVSMTLLFAAIALSCVALYHSANPFQLLPDSSSFLSSSTPPWPAAVNDSASSTNPPLSPPAVNDTPLTSRPPLTAMNGSDFLSPPTPNAVNDSASVSFSFIDLSLLLYWCYMIHTEGGLFPSFSYRFSLAENRAAFMTHSLTEFYDYLYVTITPRDFPLYWVLNQVHVQLFPSPIKTKAKKWQKEKGFFFSLLKVPSVHFFDEQSAGAIWCRWYLQPQNVVKVNSGFYKWWSLFWKLKFPFQMCHSFCFS